MGETFKEGTRVCLGDCGDNRHAKPTVISGWHVLASTPKQRHLQSPVRNYALQSTFLPIDLSIASTGQQAHSASTVRHVLLIAT